MDDIGKIDALLGYGSLTSLDAHPALQMWLHPQDGICARVQAALQQCGAHPARTVVVLPYAQLRPLATRLWAHAVPQGFAPSFETTMSWSSALRLGMCGSPDLGVMDIRFDMALDTLTARALLVQAGLGAQQDALGGLLVQAAYQLAPLAAARSPQQRAQWAQEARVAAVVGMDSATLQWEMAVARIAVEWAAISAYVTDVLFLQTVRNTVDCVVVLQGVVDDPLLQGLQSVWGAGFVSLPLVAEASGVNTCQPVRALHACADAQEEAQRTAACVLQHIAGDRFPVALVSSDRALTRRVQAMLVARGVQIRDETGWKLSTSQVATQLMALLRACVWSASADAVLAWLKVVPASGDQVHALESLLRRKQLRDWQGVEALLEVKNSPALAQLVAQVNAWRAVLQGNYSLVQWQTQLRGVLQKSGVWDVFQTQEAGLALVEVLRLSEAPSAEWNALLEQASWAPRRMQLADFTHWVNQALEGTSFSQTYPAQEQVVILPMSQMLARPFAAVVLAGCDEVRLSPSPEPAGAWTVPQRAALGLPARAALEAQLRSSWQQAVSIPWCDILWRMSDEAGEPLLASSVVQLLQWEGGAVSAHDGGAVRWVTPTPVVMPRPVGDQLPVKTLSASAYEDLRQCPYRFFALRQLGLKAVDELDVEVGKRDFGVWLHAVLKHFHDALAVVGKDASREHRLALMDEASRVTTEKMDLSEGEFLPFSAAWPAVCGGYLDWLDAHEKSGAVFTAGEVACEQPLGPVTLLGRIDRMDRLPDGSVMVLDYKTESRGKTSERVKDPLEDTQIAFYAALLPHDTLHGAYVNVGERDATKHFEQPHLVQARDALIEGILHDMEQIAAGARLPALGEGVGCDYCAVRGLCRKDAWVVQEELTHA